ncbi:hypothetical protein [Streptomyces sp. N35]|uniref:hypothetical protein n=1 Tax=Streptomyces sp. N35 TaxID=2795730 RepID=UPI0018F7B485|nr:hypothetical protein [Streptomyces sp. N35]
MTLLNNTEAVYGSETGSRCWPARPSALTPDCTSKVGKAEETARTALSWVSHEPAGTFTMLRTNAQHILNAARQYRTSQCETGPTGRSVVSRCQASAYTIAMAYPYLRAGFNGALEGR